MVDSDYSMSTIQTKNITLETQDYYIETNHENEWDYIISVFKKCNGNI
jgi:hypothetical protein